MIAHNIPVGANMRLQGTLLEVERWQLFLGGGSTVTITADGGAPVPLVGGVNTTVIDILLRKGQNILFVAAGAASVLIED